MTRFSTLRQLAAEAGDRDPFDDDSDPTEVQRPAVNLWHESQRPAAPPHFDEPPTDKGREALRHALSICSTVKPAPAAQPSRKSSWYATPIGLRRLLAKAARLDVAVAEKMDIQLTESEKAALRGAALRLKLVVEPLTEI
jgi:hypothetical protein